MPAPASTIATIKVQDGSLKLYDAAGGEIPWSRVAAAYVHGPGRPGGAENRIVTAKLPELSKGVAYTIDARLKNEQALAKAAYTVGDGKPQQSAGRLIKGVCSDPRIPADTKIARLDGGTVTMREMFAVWGTKTARLWHSVVAGGKPDAARVAADAAWAKANDLTTIIYCCTPKDGGLVIPTADQTFAYFTALAKLFALYGIEFVGEIVNEPNLPDYWRPKSLPLLQKVFVTPATAALHAAGVETIGPSATGSIETIRQLIAGGLATRSIGFHPYRTNAADLAAMLAALKLVTADKPIDLTEFTARLGQPFLAGKMTAGEVVTVLLQMWRTLTACPTVRHVCYFIAAKNKPSENSSLALLQPNADGTYRETEFSRDFWAVVQ